MMRPRHHPSDAMLVGYGSGSLGEPFSLAVATHLSFCGECRGRVRDVEAIGGALLEALEPAPLAVDALPMVLARLEDTAPLDSRLKGDATRAEERTLPSPLRSYLGDAWERRWRRVLPGIRQIVVLPRTWRGGNARLLRVSTGKSIAHHGHSGREATVVLSGSYADEFSSFGPGDFAEMDETIRHRPVAQGDADCICLIATESPLRFTGLIARLIQPVLGL